MITIPRNIFYSVMQDRPNLSYVEEIAGFKKSKSDVNLSEVMRRLDCEDIVLLMWEINENEVADFVLKTWGTLVPNRDCTAIRGVMWFDGFDCFYPPEERRDALIKRFIKDRSFAAPQDRKLDLERTVMLMNAE